MGADLHVKEQPVSETDAQSTPVWEQEERVKEQPSKREGRQQGVQGMTRSPRGETL